MAHNDPESILWLTRALTSLWVVHPHSLHAAVTLHSRWLVFQLPDVPVRPDVLCVQNQLHIHNI